MKRLLMVGSGSVLLLLAILFGAFFAGPLLASAHSSTSTSSTPAKTKKTKTTNPYCQQYQQDLANRLGVSVTTLQQDSKAARIDELAQLVKGGKLTQAQANTLQQRINSQQVCTGKGTDYEHFAVRSFLKKYRSAIVAQVAQGLHLSSTTLTSDLKSGKSLQQIAKAQNVSTASLRTIVLNAVTSATSKAVSAGDLTQAQASSFIQFLQKHPGLLNRHFSKYAR